MEMFREITRTDEVSGIKHIGEHSLRVITVFILCIWYFKNIYMGFTLMQQSNLKLFKFSFESLRCFRLQHYYECLH